jgi:LysM repeat protein
MNQKQLLVFSLFPLLLASCADQAGEDYDVSNPYAAPDYGDGTATPSLPSDVNPAYDQPAVYEETTPSVAADTSSVPATTAKVHTVVRGDSLWSIGKIYGVPIDSIKQANTMTRDIVVLGSKLNIPAR